MVHRQTGSVVLLLVVSCVLATLMPLVSAQNQGPSSYPPQVKFTGEGDHQNMMDQLGIKKLRPGANPNNQSTFDEATANKYPLPELLMMKNGTKVTRAKQWPARRAEIQEDFERE